MTPALRLLLVFLVVLLAGLQYRLWFAEGSLAERHRLQQRLAVEQARNARLRERNAAIAAEVVELQTGNRVVEQRAREELGLVAEDEVFFQFVEPSDRRTAYAAPATP